MGHLSPDLHQFYCKISFRKILKFVKKSRQIFFIANFEDVILKFFDGFRLSVPVWKALKYVNLELQCQR